MIIGICGKMGSGKTLFATALAYASYKSGEKIYSNYNLNFPHEIINLDTMLKMELQNATVVIDEIYIFMESRRSSSDINLILSYFIFQTRKRGVNLIYTAQKYSSVDIRLRELTDYVALAEKEKDNNIFHYTIYKLDTLAHPEQVINLKIGEQAFNFLKTLYKTDEIIDFRQAQVFRKRKRRYQDVL
ncbi:MAG: AAA family ATPase [Nitrososphaeria archaeon]